VVGFPSLFRAIDRKKTGMDKQMIAALTATDS
jgi:hypothetical protein